MMNEKFICGLEPRLEFHPLCSNGVDLDMSTSRSGDQPVSSVFKLLYCAKRYHAKKNQIKVNDFSFGNFKNDDIQFRTEVFHESIADWR